MGKTLPSVPVLKPMPLMPELNVLKSIPQPEPPDDEELDVVGTFAAAAVVAFVSAVGAGVSFEEEDEDDDEDDDLTSASHSRNDVDAVASLPLTSASLAVSAHQVDVSHASTSLS